MGNIVSQRGRRIRSRAGRSYGLHRWMCGHQIEQVIVLYGADFSCQLAGDKLVVGHAEKATVQEPLTYLALSHVARHVSDHTAAVARRRVCAGTERKGPEYRSAFRSSAEAAGRKVQATEPQPCDKRRSAFGSKRAEPHAACCPTVADAAIRDISLRPSATLSLNDVLSVRGPERD
jgi:hypothetical protein